MQETLIKLMNLHAIQTPSSMMTTQHTQTMFNLLPHKLPHINSKNL
jgi:hypothetical protein